MKTRRANVNSLESSEASRIDDERSAQWLLSPYSDHVWTVIGLDGREEKGTIDFRYILSNGKSLIEAERLYASVKEYSWWIHDPRYSRATSVKAHVEAARYMMKLAYALSLRNLSSFAHLQPYDIECLIEECRYGTDAVLNAYEKVDAHLKYIESENEKNPKPYGGIPQYHHKSKSKASSIMHVAQLLEDCFLPEGASQLPRVSARIFQSAIKHGFSDYHKKKKDQGIPPLKVQNVQTINNWLASLEILYGMRNRIKAESISFNPFPYGAARVAAVKGVGSKRTPTPSPTQMLYLLEKSTSWIFDKQFDIKTGSVKRSDIDLMATACWIVIATFTARRSGEIDDLRQDCLSGDDNTGWWLNIYIEKTLKQKQWIPVPSLVARSVETLLFMSKTARKASGSDLIFQWKPSRKAVVFLDVTRKLDDFAQKVNVPPYEVKQEESSYWHWHPHQFRRFFAVFYFYRFDGALLEVLSHHLRHFDIEMTKRYITEDTEVAALFTDVEWGYTGDMARSIVAGERVVSGAAGEKIKRTAQQLIKIFRKNLMIASVDRLGASLKLMMERQGLVLTSKPWVICTCPRTHRAAVKAACRRDTELTGTDIGPDFARAGATVCCNCRHAIIDKSRQPLVDKEIEHFESVVDSETRMDTIFGELERAQVITLQKVREINYEAATPLCGGEISEK